MIHTASPAISTADTKDVLLQDVRILKEYQALISVSLNNDFPTIPKRRLQIYDITGILFMYFSKFNIDIIIRRLFS